MLSTTHIHVFVFPLQIQTLYGDSSDVDIHRHHMLHTVNSKIYKSKIYLVGPLIVVLIYLNDI